MVGERGVQRPKAVEEVVEKCNERGPSGLNHGVGNAGVARGFIRGERGDDSFQERDGERGGGRNGW